MATSQCLLPVPQPLEIHDAQSEKRVPVAYRENLQNTLENLVKQDVLAPVTRPTEWVSSMVVVQKRDGRIRICLDPKELNEVMQREYYQLPIIEEVATRLNGAKLFSVLDAWNGFWHIKLEEESSYLTTFNTPFGRYRWKRMPFGISSAPEVFQRRMCETIEGLMLLVLGIQRRKLQEIMIQIWRLLFSDARKET